MKRRVLIMLLAIGTPISVALAITANAAEPQNVPLIGEDTAYIAPLSLDAPRSPARDWILLVRVGDATYRVPRAKIRELVAAHPEWLVR